MYRLFIGCIVLLSVRDCSFVLTLPSQSRVVPEAEDLSEMSFMHTCHMNLPDAPVREDYSYTPGIGAHKLHTRALTWNDARKVCNEEGGHLAIINSIEEANILLDIFNHAGPIKGAWNNENAFLGVHDLYKKGDWVTILGDSLSKTGYTEWSNKRGGQPNNKGGKQDCLTLLKDGGLNDITCGHAYAFFCELQVQPGK